MQSSCERCVCTILCSQKEKIICWKCIGNRRNTSVLKVFAVCSFHPLFSKKLPNAITTPFCSLVVKTKQQIDSARLRYLSYRDDYLNRLSMTVILVTLALSSGQPVVHFHFNQNLKSWQSNFPVLWQLEKRRGREDWVGLGECKKHCGIHFLFSPECVGWTPCINIEPASC